MSQRPHSKAYLESLLQPPPPSGAIGSRRSSLTRTTSSTGLSIAASDINQYKPARSSGLAVEGGRGEGNDEVERRIDKDEETDEVDPDIYAAITSAASISGSEDEYYDPSRFLRIHTTPGKGQQSSKSVSQSVQSILNLLDDEKLDDEDKVDKVRTALAERIEEAEGAEVSAVRLDNIVLSLLHRHREDIRPTGATFVLPASPSPSPFPASPRSRPRPANLRSMSGNNMTLSRPWTPNLPMTPTTGTAAQDSIPSLPSSPLLNPQSLSIGNGSPRASPSLWHRSISNSTNITATTNPWTHSSPMSTSSSIFAPLGPPGDTIGSPPKSATMTNKPSLFASQAAALSRPPSPGHGANDSPRLNVSAIEFKPRSSTPTSQRTTHQKPAPWLTDENTAQTTSEDSDDDEFSPFVNSGTGAVPVPGSSSSSSASSSRLVAGRTRPISGASGNSSIQSLTTAESVSGSYHGSTTSASLESSDDHRIPKWSVSSGEDDLGSVAMTPFDVLSSILSTSSTGASSWSNEQIEEALEVNNWDIDATLTAIMESGGLPGPSTTLSKSPSTVNKGVTSSANSTSGRPGVSLVSRDSFVSQRGVSGPVSGASPLPSQQSQSSSTSLSSQQIQGGGVGPGRVCRYFLAGECRRADCRFSHDLNRAVCRFWMKGQCLNGDGCSFLHDMSIVDKLTNRISTMSTQGANSLPSEALDTPPNDEFPELGLAPTGPKAQRSKGVLTPGSSNTNDPSRTRWAQALQKRTNSPMTLVQQGESHLSLSQKASGTSPAKGTPTGPRNSMIGSTSRTNGAATASRIPLHAPLLLPTLSTGKDASNSYNAYRELAISLSDKRNKLLARAAEAWKRGDGSEAKKWSREGQNVNKMLQDESRAASKNLMRERHEAIQKKILEDSSGSKGLMDPSTEERGSRGIRGKLMGDKMGVCLGVVPKVQSNIANTISLSLEERMEVLMDLHSIHSTEAVALIEEFLIALEGENYRGLALLAVGLGRHTSQETDKRRVGLAAGVRAFLNSWNYVSGRGSKKGASQDQIC